MKNCKCGGTVVSLDGFKTCLDCGKTKKNIDKKTSNNYYVAIAVSYLNMINDKNSKETNDTFLNIAKINLAAYNGE